jgi:GT2 family glycosyltransferase
MDLSIITVTYNARQQIGDQIVSVRRAAAGLSYEQVIVDNGSTDGTVEYIQANFPEVRVIANSTNRGFGRANNQGVEVTTAPYILFLNPDNRLVGENDLARFVAWITERPFVGIAGPSLLDMNNQLNTEAMPRRFPRLIDLLLILFKIPHVFPRILDHYLYHDFNFSREQLVDSVRGSCMLMRRSLIQELGFAFDPRYFIWFEDVDTCREAYRHHYQVVYTPVISCYDLVGQTFATTRWSWKQKQLFVSMVQYIRKWGVL